MMPEPRQILTTGVPVLTADGRRGRLHQALLSPGHCRLHALVIRYGMLPPRDVVVPVEQVAAITDAQVRLRLSRAELAQLPTYQSAWRMHSAPGGARRALVALQYGSGGTSERIIEVPSSTALAIAERQGSPTDGLIALRAGQTCVERHAGSRAARTPAARFRRAGAPDRRPHQPHVRPARDRPDRGGGALRCPGYLAGARPCGVRSPAGLSDRPRDRASTWTRRCGTTRWFAGSTIARST